MAQKTAKKDTLTGKRKTAIARLSMKAGKGELKVNGKEAKDYFGNVLSTFKRINTPFELTGTLNQYDVVANVRGGGLKSQADAVMYAIAKALIKVNPEHRAPLKAAEMVLRDARIKERKKYGLKKARKSFQWTKR